MQTIFPLSQSVRSKIAAGEVIERPSYVIKELIENALDAKATNITIEVAKGGLASLTVTDNGIGMSKEDLVVCFHPFTTSKISTETDLLTIRSLGFRGEALASIAVISDMTIKSRKKGERGGNEVVLSAGSHVRSTPVGMSEGTTITIENLFYTIPARKKFLSNISLEARYILETVIVHALAFPSVGFSYLYNNKQLFSLARGQSLASRIQALYGDTYISLLLPLSFSTESCEITGYILSPVASTLSEKPLLFLNNRPIHDKAITHALLQGYKQFMALSHSPFFILFLTIPVELIDINIHPQKEKAHLFKKTVILEAITQAVYQTLQKSSLVYAPSFSSHKTTRTHIGKMLRDAVLTKDPVSSLRRMEEEKIMQVHNVYILVSSPQGIIIIDQHAAHERILFEKLLKEFTKKSKQKNPYLLPVPLTLTFSLKEAFLLHSHTILFHDVGFIYTLKRDQSITLSHIPDLFFDHNPKQLLDALLQEIQEENDTPSLQEYTKKMIRYLACKMAVKAGDTLTDSMQKQIVRELHTTPNATTCPHGRPTKIVVPFDEIGKLFRRE